jgi:surface polysaccharide O-acyltransferase-like enzyme
VEGKGSFLTGKYKTGKSGNRIIYYDILNILACFAVISLHHNGAVHGFSNTLVWKEALFVEVVAYWAVPIFLMLSGATLLNYRSKYDTKIFFKKRFSKVLIPFLVWSVLVLIWKCNTGQYTIQDYSIQNIINIILNYRMESVYWYFPIQFSIYLIIPLLSLLVGEKYRKTLWYVTIAIFLTQSVIPPISKLVGISWNGGFNFPIGGYVLFVLLGYLLSTIELNKKTRIIIYIISLCAAAFRYVAIYTLSIKSGIKDPTFFAYVYFPGVLLSIGVFVFFKQIDWDRLIGENKKTLKVISEISSCSLGIYLIHKIVMYYEMLFWNLDNSRLIWRTVMIFETYFIALLIIYLLKKIPIINRIVP